MLGKAPKPSPSNPAEILENCRWQYRPISDAVFHAVEFPRSFLYYQLFSVSRRKAQLDLTNDNNLHCLGLLGMYASSRKRKEKLRLHGSAKEPATIQVSPLSL